MAGNSKLKTCSKQEYQEWLVGTSRNGLDLLDFGDGTMWEVVNYDECGFLNEPTFLEIACRPVDELC